MEIYGKIVTLEDEVRRLNAVNEAIHKQIDGHREVLRDRFAMAALTGILYGIRTWHDEFPEMAYQYADAMLAAKEKKP